MASSEDDEWDVDTAEINSLDSEELYNSRPNRWKGAPSTWRTLTDADRTTYHALEAVRSQDLAIHLYNAFALKLTRARRDPRRLPDPTEDVNALTGEPVRPTDWIPPKQWTAWPMRANDVPPDDYAKASNSSVPRQLRGQPYARSSYSLEDEVSATILRLATERFRRRDLGSVRENVQSREEGDEGDEGDEETNDSDEGGGVSDSSNLVVKEEVLSDATRASSSTTSRPKKLKRETSHHRRRRPPSRTFLPVPSADDDLSYEFVRPAARRILARLDDVLVVLHNVRAAGLALLSESSPSSSEAERPATQPSGARTQKPGKGRPRRVRQPREGETEREMLVRVARQNHKRIPVFSDEDGDSEGGGKQTETRREKSSTESPVPAAAAASSSSGDGGGGGGEKNHLKEMGRSGLRDWRDVLGAAALAGFSPAVLARATQRCANLFGEGMDMHTLVEVPAAATGAGSNLTSRTTTRYVPGQPPPASSGGEDSNEETDDIVSDLRRLRSLSRGRDHGRSVTSRRLPSSPDPASSGKEDTDRSSRSRRSATPGAAPSHYCPHTDCPRAIEGFVRQANLVRHMKAMHGGTTGCPPASVASGTSAGNSEDELDGAVHVDGFLRPIKMRSGWRGPDSSQRRGRSGKRRGSESESESESDRD